QRQRDRPAYTRHRHRAGEMAGERESIRRRRRGDGRYRRRRGALVQPTLSLPPVPAGRQQIWTDAARQPGEAPSDGCGPGGGAAQAGQGLGQPLSGPGIGSAISGSEGLELRPIHKEEQRAYSTLMRRAFGASLPTDEELAVARETTEFDRTLAFFDGAEIVATAGIFTYELTVPGGTLPCGGVTRVSVLSTHRRRGLLTAMMRRQLDDMHERGEPLAALYASEAPIYGRFGYGLATYQAAVEVDRSHAGFAKALTGSGRLAMVDVPTAVGAFTRIWEQARRDQPGMLRLDERWIRSELADLELHREGASPHYRVIYQTDDNPSGFAVYRIKLAWDASGPNGALRLEMLVATSAEAYAALWRHLLDVDLMARVSAEMRPVDEPLRFLLADSRQPKTGHPGAQATSNLPSPLGGRGGGPHNRTVDRETCLSFDRQDPLAAIREEFVVPDGLIYLDGNSLGALPRRTVSRLNQVVAEE